MASRRTIADLYERAGGLRDAGARPADHDTRGVIRRLAERPLAVAALLVVVLDAAFAAAGAAASVLSLAALLAPGLALAPLLPARIRESPLAVLAAAPALGCAASAVALITVASAGASLEPAVVRGVLAVLVLGGLALPWPEWQRPPGRGDLPAAGGLALALAAGALLQQRVIGGDPIPGNDWAKYLLYADEIVRQGSLLIDNPFWMLGVPFREDPAVPALYGSFLALSGEPAGTLTHGIWVFAVSSILAVFAFTRAFWGERAAVAAAALWAVLPISHDILGWHGAPNLAAIALLPLVLAYVVALVGDRDMSAAEIVGFGLCLVALAATHRLSTLVAGIAVLVAIAAAAAQGRGQALRIARRLGFSALVTIALAPGVVYDLYERGRTFGGTQSYRAYLSSKLEIGPLVGDLTVVFTALALVAVVLAVRWARTDRALAVLLALLATAGALTFSWLLEIPLHYLRMAYFLPLALVPMVAVAITRLLTPRRAAAAAAVAALAIGTLAWFQADRVRSFYGFTNLASLRGLDSVSASLRPGEVVVTDRCWSFQAAWLLHTPTLPALEPEDIQPKAELRRARQARAVLDGTPEGLRLAKRLGVRYLLVDPTCPDADGQPGQPPAVGAPLYVSTRLVVLKLPRAS